MLNFFSKKIALMTGTAAPPPPKAPTFEVPTSLPNLKATTGADLAKVGGFKPAPGAVDPATQTPSQFLGDALNQRQEAMPATRAIAHNMNGNDGVKWAVDSCKTVQGKMTEPDQAALKAADDYLAKPTPAKQALAAEAAGKTDFQGPGAWAAKAAALVKPEGTAPTAATPAMPALSPHLAAAAANPSAECVAGAVALSAALASGKAPPPPAAEIPKVAAPALDLKAPTVALAAPAPTAPDPNQAAQTANALKPFIDRGLQIAAGKA